MPAPIVLSSLEQRGDYLEESCRLHLMQLIGDPSCELGLADLS